MIRPKLTSSDDGVPRAPALRVQTPHERARRPFNTLTEVATAPRGHAPTTGAR